LVSRRNPKFVETYDGIQLVKFANGKGPEVSGAGLACMPGVSTVEDILCPWISEGHDHAILVAWNSCYGKNGGQRLGELDIMTSELISAKTRDYCRDGVATPHIRRSSKNSDGGSTLVTSR
jgi:hypothetical protein